MRVSANLIALNEQRSIARCLQSLSWVDEIVVVDGGSNDATVNIVRDFTDCVYVHPFDDYSSQRNRALNRSHGEWVFSIDCDEWVTPELAREIRATVLRARPECSGFWVPIRSRIFGRSFRYSGTQGERKMRLFRREGVRWQGKVHETVGMCGWAGCLKNAIEHESTPDVDTYLGKLIRYSSFEASAQLSSGRCPHWSQRWFGPLRQFARLYFGKLGFLDGPEGFRFCALSALQVWITHQKVIEQMRRVESPLTRADTSESKEYCHGPAIAAA